MLFDLKDKKPTARIVVLDDLNEVEADKRQDLAHLLSSLRKHRSVLVRAGSADNRLRELAGEGRAGQPVREAA